MSYEDMEKTAAKGPFGTFKVVMILVLLTLFGGGIVTALGFMVNPFVQTARIINKTIDADNVLHNYEYFKKQFRAVDAIDDKITKAQLSVAQFREEAGPRKDWGYEDKTEYSRINSIATGLEFQRADMVADYNAKANMANKSIFMGDDCPQEIK